MCGPGGQISKQLWKCTAFKLSEMQSEVQLCVRKTQKQRGLDREAISVKLEEKHSKRSLWLLIAVFAQVLGFIYIRNVYLAFPMLEYPGKLKNLDLIEDRIQKTFCELSRNDGFGVRYVHFLPNILTVFTKGLWFRWIVLQGHKIFIAKVCKSQRIFMFCIFQSTVHLVSWVVSYWFGQCKTQEKLRIFRRKHFTLPVDLQRTRLSEWI